MSATGHTPERLRALHDEVVQVAMRAIAELTEVADRLPPADRRAALCSFMVPGVCYALGQTQAAIMMKADDRVWDEVTTGTGEALAKGWAIRDEPTARKIIENVSNGRPARHGLAPEESDDDSDPLLAVDEMLQRVRATRHP